MDLTRAKVLDVWLNQWSIPPEPPGEWGSGSVYLSFPLPPGYDFVCVRYSFIEIRNVDGDVPRRAPSPIVGVGRDSVPFDTGTGEQTTAESELYGVSVSIRVRLEAGEFLPENSLISLLIAPIY